MLALLFLAASQTSAPVTLLRTSHAGEAMKYAVKSHIQTELRGSGLDTWMPQDLDLNYDFSLHINKLSPGGMMNIRYSRPTMTQITGETFDSPPSTDTVNLGLVFDVTLSPVNEIVEEKDVPKGDKHRLHEVQRVRKILIQSDFGNPLHNPGLTRLLSAQGDALSYVREIYRLALNIGSLDTSLDFDPKLPLDEVKPGDTWKKTVGYSPQSTKNSKGIPVVQRLDYTYTFGGLVDSQGKKVYRVTADLELHTDLAGMVNKEMEGYEGDEPPPMLKSLPLNLTQHLEFDLDPKTCETLRATTHSEGGFSFTLQSRPGQAMLEERFKGDTEMGLLTRS